MDIKTFRAATMQQALASVRRELGPDAAILHTREVRSKRLFGWLDGPRQIEVTASLNVNVPSRLPARSRPSISRATELTSRTADSLSEGCRGAPRNSLPEVVQEQLCDLQGMVKDLCRRATGPSGHDLPEELFRLFTDLLDADVNEETARQLVDHLRAKSSRSELGEPAALRARLVRMLEAEIRVSGPIAVIPGRRRLAALVGPTGVGKTTTIAKLAAHYRLKEKRRVGLITVDTYRVAAVEQLRTYADIIDLPMQVVSTPREMHDALQRLEGLDLVLMDTAGRSPKDEVKIQELKAFLAEADADEVHLVLSAVASQRTLAQTAQQFASVGTTALVLTKLDEAPSLGHVLPLLRTAGLPVSYLTNGQNVPDDIETAAANRVAAWLLGLNG